MAASSMKAAGLAGHVLGVGTACEPPRLRARSGADPRAVAPGEDVISTMPGGRYGIWSGTSMSAPIGAGVAAILHAQFPAMAPHEIVDRIVENGFD